MTTIAAEPTPRKSAESLAAAMRQTGLLRHVRIRKQAYRGTVHYDVTAEAQDGHLVVLDDMVGLETWLRVLPKEES